MQMLFSALDTQKKQIDSFLHPALITLRKERHNDFFRAITVPQFFLLGSLSGAKRWCLRRNVQKKCFKDWFVKWLVKRTLNVWGWEATLPRQMQKLCGGALEVGILLEIKQNTARKVIFAVFADFCSCRFLHSRFSALRMCCFKGNSFSYPLDNQIKSDDLLFARTPYEKIFLEKLQELA